MTNNTTAQTKIQVYLSYPGGGLCKVGRPVSLQRATEMMRMFKGSVSDCMQNGGTAKLTYDVTEGTKNNRGKIIFELPYTEFMKFTCNACMGPCVSLPLDAETKMKICRNHIRYGACKDPVISSVIGCNLYPKKYCKTR